MSYFLSNIFAVFSFVYQIEIIKMYGKVLLLIENNEETPFFWCSNSNIGFAEMNIKSSLRLKSAKKYRLSPAFRLRGLRKRREQEKQPKFPHISLSLSLFSPTP